MNLTKHSQLNQLLVLKHDLPEEIINVNGGAIALGHPLGGSGGILTCKIFSELKRRKKIYRSCKYVYRRRNGCCNSL